MTETTPGEVKELEKELNAVASQVGREGLKPRVNIAVPNMVWLNAGLVAKLFYFANSKEIVPEFHLVSEKRHTDYARNVIAKSMLQTGADWLCMFDHDTDPHPKFFDLLNHPEPIISACVDCWVAGELIPSIWEMSACEQCINLKKFQETGEIHDPREYRAEGNTLLRWNPFSQRFEGFFKKVGRSGVYISKCRCGGTGLDPWVFKMHRHIITSPEYFNPDSVGTAAILIHRSVFEKMPFPWFRFLYREDGEIMLTEDHYFCWKAGLTGFKIGVDPQMFCSHFKLVDLLGVKAAMNKAFEAGKAAASTQSHLFIPTEKEIAQIVK